MMDPIALEEQDIDDEMDEEEEEEEDGPKFIDASVPGYTFVPVSFPGAEDASSGEEEEIRPPQTSSPGSTGSAGSGMEQKHRCTICKSFFLSAAHLESHIETSHKNKCAWTCQHCSAIFSDVEMFKLHLVKQHKSNKEIFTLEDPSRNPLLDPAMSVPEGLDSCPECNLQFLDSNSLNLHRVRKHSAKPQAANLPCPICQEENIPDLTQHVRKEHNVHGVVCPHCGKILSKTCTLNRHIEQVHLNLQIHKPATCEVCGKVFSKKGHLDRHRRTIHQGMKESSEPCPYCGKVFSTKSSLEPHIEMVHKGVRKECEVCGKVLSDLWKHMRTVHGQYRRRTKIPKDGLSDEDEAEFDEAEDAKPDMDEEDAKVLRASPRKRQPQSYSVDSDGSDLPDHIRDLIDRANKEGEAAVNGNSGSVEEPSAKIVRLDRGSKEQKQKQTRFGKKAAVAAV